MSLCASENSCRIDFFLQITFYVAEAHGESCRLKSLDLHLDIFDRAGANATLPTDYGWVNTFVYVIFVAQEFIALLAYAGDVIFVFFTLWVYIDGIDR